MTLLQLKDSKDLVYQVSGPNDAPTLLFLPGVHGDWTPLSEARPFLNGNFRFVEVAYPRRADWQLEDFAQALENLLDELAIPSTHLVGESFGSLIGWKFLLTRPERAKTFVLVGGFAAPPTLRTATFASLCLRAVPTHLLERGVDAYCFFREKQGRPRMVDGGLIAPYPAVRTTAGRKATAHRMSLIQRSDFRDELKSIKHQIRYIAGARDGMVQVRREIRRLSSELPVACNFEGKLIPGAPHMVIASHPELTASYITNWVLDCVHPPSPKDHISNQGKMI